MITNNTSYKLKASKSSRSNQDYQEQDDNESADGDATGDSNNKYTFYVSRLPKIRLKHNFYINKTSRGGDRRNAFRARNNAALRKGERDFNDSSYMGRYDMGFFPYGKYTESEKKAEIKFNLPEDTRISKLLRRLSVEEDPDNSLQLSSKLLEVLMLPDNAVYIRKSFAILRDSMVQILHVAPGPLAKKQCARAFGRIGYIMAQDSFDFSKYVKVVMKYNLLGGNEEMVSLFMIALKETLDLEKQNSVLDKNRIYGLMQDLILSIEPTDNVEVFKLILDNLMTCVEFHPNNFTEFFKDTTDLLFGWHVDHTQPLCNIEFISNQLVRVASHFQRNLDFSVTLIVHFMEDIETYSNQMLDDDDSEGESVDHVIVFILALNTVLKCLNDHPGVVEHKLFTKKLLSNAMQEISKAIKRSTELQISDNLIITGNECISLLLNFLLMKKAQPVVVFNTSTTSSDSLDDDDVKESTVTELIMNVVNLELNNIDRFSRASIISMLMLTCKVIRELYVDLKIDLIPKLIGPNSDVLKLRYLPYREIREATVIMYQALLNMKNIPLLQEVYRYLLGDLELSYQYFLPSAQILGVDSNNPFLEIEPSRTYQKYAEINCLFLLQCLARLANDSGSIVGMWVLRPSLLELLGGLMEPYNKSLAKHVPELQQCILQLLYSHCKCYNFFMSSSKLLNVGKSSEFSSASPNSGNFAIMLNVVCKSFVSEPIDETMIFLLQWSQDILMLGETFLELLYVAPEFLELTEILLECAHSRSHDIAIAAAKNLEKLVDNRRLSWKHEFLIEVNKICTLHMASTNPEVRIAYTKLYGLIPWDVALAQSNNLILAPIDRNSDIDLRKYSLSSIQLGKQLHVNGSVFGEMPAHSFKTLMNFLLKNEPPYDNFIERMYESVWPLEADNQLLSDQYRDLAVVSRPLVYNWATWEAAQLCINSKLRTPLGKPNETFTSFENALKHLARDVMKLTAEGSKPPDNVRVTRVRLFLQFIDHLEMCIYNASEGTAFAIPQASKPVRTFFSTNAQTCREWLSRIRIVLVQLALHAGQSSIAVRHGQQLIADFIKQGKTESVDFERAIVYLTMAFLNLRESEAITGLYVMCKSTCNRKFEWLRCVADQANNKYEIAALGYQTILDNLHNNPMDAYTRMFIIDQIIRCFKELSSWLDVIQCKNLLISQGDNDSPLKFSFNMVNFECAQSIFNMETSTHAFDELTSWTELDCRYSWSSYDKLKTNECDLYNAALNILAANNKFLLGKLEDKQKDINKIIQESALFPPVQFQSEFFLLNYVIGGIRNVLNGIPAIDAFNVSANYASEIPNIDCAMLSKILWWSEYFVKIQNDTSAPFTDTLRLNIVKKARKEGNENLACTHLYRFFKSKNMLFLEDRGAVQQLLFSIAESFRKKIPEISMWTMDAACGIQELIKLLYEEPNQRKLTFDLCAIASTAISKSADLYGTPDLKMVSSKILLKLGTWLQSNEQVSVTEIASPLGKLLMVLPEIGIENIGGNVIPINEMVIGKLLQFSVNQCQTLAKAWHAFGTWCYRWGRKIVDNSMDLSSTLTVEDQEQIRKFLPRDCKPEELNRIMAILSQSRTYVDEEDIDANEVHTSDMIRAQLSNTNLLINADERINALVEIWRNLQKRVYAYYGHSVEAYFKYLQLASSSDNVSKATESNTVTVTLRLLRLIVKHALELQDVLEQGLETTPTHPWKIIIPQLFSRLNHPESYVRERVSELLCRVAEDAPHLITFPAVVGALEGGVKFAFSEISLPKDCLSQNNESNEDPELNDIEDNYDSDNDESKNVLQACFKSMVDTLSKQAPETITQVQTLVKELRRIILLWDELWHGTLAQHHNEINKRQQQMELEIEKLNNNEHLSHEQKISLISEKHRIIIKPIIFILEQLYDITSVEPETPHERHFQDKYLKSVESILQKLKNPENPNDPQESWTLLRELQNQFTHKANKRSMLRMQEISPVLANIRNTEISMPGQEVKTKVFISNVSNQVSILPTKTRPKKLIFHGSDGYYYTYLFKGLEDLHLDERIMQFLSISNTMMAENTEGSGHNLYRARHYSVIPLGPRSGLISWVGGTTPVFALYKRWQQRDANRTTKTGSVAVLRPSELFYNKLHPLLHEHGVKNIDNRKEWPLAALKQVLLELMAETPSNLLAKELWCHAVSPGAWWQIVRKYTYSVAVMSIIGYIIGLGDRHLDNVLVDLNTGEVVHIDYNVCFEKGKTLRIPEKVPFRLTPNIRDAFGVTGIEGMFRLACENILKTMKRGRETLLTLLEAFVYDPLVDWTVGNDGLVGTTFGGLTSSSSRKQTRKDLEQEVTLAMYRVRCTEVKTEWELNKIAILDQLPELYELLDTWQELCDQSSKSDDLLQDLHQQMALVKEAEANGLCKHTLHSLPARYDSFRKTQDTFAQATRDLEKFETECENHIKRFEDAMKLLQTQQVQQWYLELSSNRDNSAKPFDLVTEFLKNAGQSNLILQCEQIENDISTTFEQQLLLTHKSLNMLQEYSTIFAQCPPSYIENHRINYYKKWSRLLLNTHDVSVCDQIYQQFFALNNLTNKPIKAILNYSYNLNIMYNNIAAKTAKAYEDLNTLRAEEPNMILESRYAEAKMCLTNLLQHEKKAPSALEFVIISELLVLNNTFLSLETAASKTGDWLIKLTSREGAWFLDELTLSSSKAMELISYLRLHNGIDEDENLMKVVNGLNSANNLYKSLHELNFNFHTIILPESIKKIQSEEMSVLQMIHDLNAVVMTVGSLQDLTLQLEKNLTCIIMEMDFNSKDILQEKMTNLKRQYQELLQSSNVLSSGKMLLMGFNGLFDKLHLESKNVFNQLGNLNVPSSWRKLDQVKEAKSLATLVFNPQVHTILDDIFLLKRLQTMCEFFALCIDMCQSFKGLTDTVVSLDDEQLLKPIRKFIADFMSRQFLGISTEGIAYVQCYLLQRLGLDVTNEIEQKDIGAENKVPLEELYRKGWNIFLKKGMFSQNLFSQVTGVESNVKNAWEKLQEPKKLEKNVTLLQSSLTRIQNQLTAYNWLHEEVLAQQLEKCTFLRSKFIVDFRGKTGTLTLLQNKVKETLEKQKTVVASICQRLKWAAGANPDLNEKLFAFEKAIANREKQQILEQQVFNYILSACTNVLHFELLRCTSPESKACDQIFINNYQQWIVACQYDTVKIETVTPVEQNIMKFYSKDMAKDPKWILQVSEKISESIKKTQSEAAELKIQLFKSLSNTNKKLDGLKLQYNIHCTVMNDFKNLIKTMTKIDECMGKSQQFVCQYRQYIDNFSSVFHQIRKDPTIDDVSAIRNKLRLLNKTTEEIYYNLLELETKKCKKQLVRQEGATLSPVRAMPHKQGSMTKGQQRNAYAVGVWRRVRMKLEGKDPDPGRKHSIQEQVDYIIREATSIDNLALLYEGWTPWV